MQTSATPPVSMPHYHSSLTLFQKLSPFIVVFSASLYFFFEFMQVNIFNALDPSLYKAFHLTNATQLGELSACYMYAVVLLLFPAGMILDRLSTRNLIIFSMFTCVLCTFLFSLTTALWQAELCRLMTGFAGAFCLLSNVRLASRWFPPKHMALIVGLIVTFAMLGGLAAQAPFTKLIQLYGWRHTLRIDAMAGLIMLGIILLTVRDYPKGTQSFFEQQHATLMKVGFWPGFKEVIFNLQNWLAGLYTSLINIPVFLLGSTWGNWYLTQTHHMDAMHASYVVMMLFIGLIIGSPAIGWMSDAMGKRKLPMILGAIASLVVIFAIMYVPHLSFYHLMALFFALGFVISSQIIGYPLVAESNPSVLTGTAEGLASTLIMAGGFLIPVFPALLNEHWNHALIHGIPLYTVGEYRLAFMIMPIAFVIALIASLFVRETHCKAFEE